MPFYFFKDAKGNKHTVDKAAYDNDPEGFAKAFPGARMEVIDGKTKRRGDVDVKDAGRIGAYGARLFTGQYGVGKANAPAKTALGRAAQSVAAEKWGGSQAAGGGSATGGGKPHWASVGLSKPSGNGGKAAGEKGNGSGESWLVGELRKGDAAAESAGREIGRKTKGALRRSESAAFDTGDKGANRYVVKTHGQLDRELGKSGRDVAGGELGDYIRKSIAGELSAAQGRGVNAERALGQASPFGYMAAGREYNRALDPDELLKRLSAKASSDLEGLLSKPGVQDEIRRNAAKLGVSEDEYVRSALAPGLQEKLAEEFEKSEIGRSMPKSTAEYVLRGLNESMLGTIASMGMTTKRQRQYAQQGMALTDEGMNRDVQPGMASRVARGTAAFVGDAPVFGAAGKAGMAVAGKVMGNGVAQAARVANTSLAGRLGRMAATGAVSQGVTGVLYGASNAAVQNYSTGDDTSIGNTVKLMVKGGASEGTSWATMGAVGGAVGAGMYGIGGWKRVPAKAVQLAMEGIGMHLGGNVAKTIEGEETDWTSLEGNLEACANVVALKLTHARLPKRMEKGGVKEGYLDYVARKVGEAMTSDASRSKGYVFTEEEKEQLFGSGHGPKSGEDIYGYDASDKPMTRKESLTSWAMRVKRMKSEKRGEESYGETDAEFVKTAYDEIMADSTIPWDTKAKFSALVMGTVPTSRPMMDSVRLGSDAEKGRYVGEYSKYGELLSKSYYKTAGEYGAILFRLNSRRENERLGNAYGAATVRDESGADATLAAVGKRYGLTAEEMREAMEKDPVRRSDEEQAACVELRKAYEGELFREGELHPEQSQTEGKDVVEENGLGTETPKSEAVAEVLANVDKAEKALQSAMDSDGVLKEEYERMKGAGMSEPEIYMGLMDGGMTKEQLAPLADWINAQWKAAGMYQGTARKIEETTEAHVAQWGYKGELNGEKQDGGQMVVVRDGAGRQLIVGAGDVAFDGEGRTREGVGDMLTVLDPQTGEMDFVSVKDVTLERVEPGEEYAARYKEELEVKNSEGYLNGGDGDEVGKPSEASLSLSEPRVKSGEKSESNVEAVVNDGEGGTDKNGNVLNSDGSIYTEKVERMEDITNGDFDEPSRSVELPAVPENVAAALGSEGKPIVIKKNIFEKNLTNHPELEPEDSRAILNEALYNPTLVGQTQPVKRPSYKVAVRTGDKNSIVVLDVYADKKQTEIVGWRRINERGLAKMQRQAEREGGQFLILSPDNGSAAALSALPNGSSSDKGKSSLHPKTQIEESVPRSDSQELTESGNQPLGLGVNSPEPSTGKDSEKSSDGGENKETLTFADGTAVPMTNDSKGRETGDLTKMTAQQGAEYVEMSLGEMAGEYVDGKIKAAESAVKKAEKAKVDMSGDMADVQEALRKKKESVARAKAELSMYAEIKKSMTERRVKRTMEKSEETVGKPSEASLSLSEPRRKFEGGRRIAGNKRVRTLADGTKIKGHYELVEAESLTPSHDATDGYKKSDGFPVNAEGRTMNDRDYEHDKDAQTVTDEIARNYDGQAVDQVPVVTADGIVVDGNGRTMAGQKAAKDGTDGAYMEALRENAENYGFTAEQVDGMKHPRLVLVSDEPIAYDTATFAKFNKNEKKAQGNTQQAVANSKKLGAEEVSAIVAEIEGSGSLDAFFNNPAAINSLLKRLVDKGVIGLNEVAGLREGDDKLSASGKDFVKNLLLGSVFSEDTIRMMGADAGLKGKALGGIRAVLDNMKLGDYALGDEIDKAMQLVYEARQMGGGVDALLRTPSMFGENAADRYDPVSQAIALALDGKAEDFRELMQAYNRNAQHYADAQQTELFGERPTKEEFVNEFLKLRNWKDYETRHSDKEGAGDVRGAERSEPEARGGEEEGKEGVEEAEPRQINEQGGKDGSNESDERKESQSEIDEALKSVATEISRKIGDDFVVTDEGEAERRLSEAGGEESQLKYSKRERPAPKKTQRVYKLMRLGDDGKLYPLFIDSTAPTELGVWYDADSPDLSMLKGVASGVHLVDPKTGKVVSYDNFYAEHPELFKGKQPKYPSKDALKWAADRGMRFVFIEDTKKGQKRFGGESRKYWNLGLNGSGTVATFSMRPGWHAGSLPTMRQIGKGKDKNLRDDRFVWVEGEVSADKDYTAEAEQNPDKDLPDRIPEDGYYMKATNADKAKSQADRVGWYVAGAFKANRIMSDKEARGVIDKWNEEHPDKPVEYDYERESGREFNAETMRLEDVEGRTPSERKEFRTKDGEVYGFTDGEKIYLDVKKMKPETPLHEYTHLWGAALRRVNPKEWENVKGLLDNVDGLKEEIEKLYPELKGDDLYDEMLAMFSGRNGAKKLEDVCRQLAAEDGKRVTDSAKEQGFIDKVKTALQKFWKATADLMHIKFTTAEDVADKVLADWARGYDPREKSGESAVSDFEKFLEDSGKETEMSAKERSSMARFSEKAISLDSAETSDYPYYNAKRSSVEIPADKLYKSERDWFSVKGHGDVIAFHDKEKKCSYELVGHKDSRGYLTSVSVIKYHGFAEEDSGKVRYQKADEAQAKADEREKALRDEVVGTMRKAGLDVSMDTEEGQRVLDEANGKAKLSAKKRRALETASLGETPRSLTVVSSADGAKILKSIDTLATEFDNSATQPKTFVGDVAKALGAERNGSASEYATFETKNGRIVTIRLANHNAKVSNFDNRDESEGISIVVSPKKSEGMTNDGAAHVVEYYYDALKLRRADGKPLADIVRSIKQALYSGEFEDTTGLAERQEVNAEDVVRYHKVYHGSGADHVRFFRTADGEAYGYTIGGKIYIDPSIANSETPVHEYAHLWATALRKGNAEEWKNVVGLMKDTKVWDEVKKRYPELEADDDVADEVLATYSGRRGAERLRREMDSAGGEAKGALARVKEAIRKFWKATADMLHIHYTTAEEVADRVMKDLLDGVDPRKVGASPIEGMEKAAAAWRSERELQKKSGVDARGSEELFVSLQDKKGKDYYDTVDILSERLADGRADLYGVSAGAGRKAGSRISAGIEIIAASREGQHAAGAAKGNESKPRWASLSLTKPRGKEGEDESAATGGVAGEDTPRFQKVEDKDELEKLDKEKTFRMYSTLQMVDGVYASPMAGYEGENKKSLKLTNTVEPHKWYRSDEMKMDFSDEQLRQMDELDKGNKPGKVVLAPNKLIYEKSSKGGKGALKFKLQKTRDESIWANYNPYNHTSTSMMNDQFTGAYGRSVDGNVLVTVEWEIPESEKTSGYWAEKAHDPVGFRPWHSGVVNQLLPEERQRSVMLSRYRKMVRAIPFAEVAKSIAAQLKGSGLAIPWNTLPKQLLEEVAKLGVPITTVPAGKSVKQKYVDAFNEQRAEIEKKYPQARFVDVEMTKDAYKEWGKDGGTHYRIEEDLEGVNRKFNERLDSLAKDPTQKGRELQLGRPGEFLKDAGLGDSEIVLDYDRLARKASEKYRNSHPFSIDDIKDLPKAINSPIAVFDNTNGENRGKVILTEIEKDGKNFIVAVRASERRQKGGVVLEVNEIRTLFPKESRGIVNWLNTGKASNINKEKALAWLGALRTHRGTELTEQELSDAAKVVNDFDIAKQKRVNYRIGGDNETNGSNESNADKAQERIVAAVEKAAKKTGARVNVVRSAEEIKDGRVKADILSGKKVTGWYDEKTGEVHLYMPNIKDSYTAEKTVWHETVGHKGMRGLLGDGFDGYMRGLWMDLDNPVNRELRAFVKERMNSDHLGFYDAIEEYIAKSAEEGRGEPGFWNYIKNKVTDALRETGYRVSPNVKDVKWMLWLAKNVQKHGSDPWWKMRAEAVRWKIEHERTEYTKIHGGELYDNDGESHDFEGMSREEWKAATDGEIHYRTAPSAATALDRYHKMLDRHGYMATEAFMDNMLSLKHLMEAIDPKAKKVEDVAASMNPYLMQNITEGKMAMRAERFREDYMVPLDKAMAGVLDSFDGKTVDERIRSFNLYMIRKHGLERNRVLYVRDMAKKLEKTDAKAAEKLRADWVAEKLRLGTELRNGKTDLKAYYAKLDEWIRKNVDAKYKAEEHDYSGMHGLQRILDPALPYDDAGATDEVMSQEAKMEGMKKGSVNDFWNKVKGATNYSVQSDYESGLISKETKDHVTGMFDWYVPLRKYDETTAEDVYGYVTELGNPANSIGDTLMHAKGRKSLSNVEILAQIGLMGNRAIRNGGQNEIKQAFARFVRNSGEQNLVRETKVWVVKTGTDAAGNAVWEEAYPKIPDLADADDINQIVNAFEADMKSRSAKGEAKSLSQGTDIGFKFLRAKDKSQHFVDVRIAGRTHRFVVMGNPRAAQAVNGMLENGKAMKGMKWLQNTTRWMAMCTTSWSPEFVMRNILRDAEFAASHVAAKEGARYAAKWARYYAELSPLNMVYNEGAGALKGMKWRDLKNSQGFGLYARYREGTLGGSKMEQRFREFMENGGETGFVQLHSMADMEKDYKSMVKRASAKGLKKGLVTGSDIVRGFFGAVESLNEVAENMARFATFCASRDMGRSAARSAYDAKEVSTNFNRHGSGDAVRSFKDGETGRAARVRRATYGGVAGYLRRYSMFFNAGIQSTNLLLKSVKRAPAGTLAGMMATPFALGLMAALVNNWRIANEDKKERGGVNDPYGELPDYIRRNSLCFYMGKGRFATLPLSIELRAFYGLGDLVAGKTVAGNVESQRNMAMDAVGCLSQLLPVMDFLNDANFEKSLGSMRNAVLKAAVPTPLAAGVEWAVNSDWKGAPIRRTGDDTELNPAWMNAYSNVPGRLIDINKMVNAKTNDIAPGTPDMKGNELLDMLTDPSMASHFFGAYTGGAGTFVERTLGTVDKAAQGKWTEVETGDIPFWRSLWYTPREQSSMARTKAKWYGYKEETEQAMANYDSLNAKNVPLTKRIENLAALEKFNDSEEAKKIRIIKDAEKEMRRWTAKRKRWADDKAQVDMANGEIERIMQEAVEEIEGLSGSRGD